MPRRGFYYARNTSAKRVFSRTLGSAITRKVRAETNYQNYKANEQRNLDEEKRKALIEEQHFLENQKEEAKDLSKELKELCARQGVILKIIQFLGILLALYVVLVMYGVGGNSELIGKSWPFLFLIPITGLFLFINSRYTSRINSKMEKLGYKTTLPEK